MEKSHQALHANNLKGRLVESIVAELHVDGSSIVEKNVLLPVIGKAKGKCEIDVLLTGKISGYTIRIPIECKNYRKVVGAGKINEFVGKVQAVGLATENAIFISPVGFTKDAFAVAERSGVRLLCLDGLDDKGMGAKVVSAAASTLYILPVFTQFTCKWNEFLKMDLSHRKNLQPEKWPNLVYLENVDKDIFIADLAAGCWNNSKNRKQLGKYAINVLVEEPANLITLYEGHTCRITEMTFEFEIKALAYTVDGKGESYALRDATSNEIHKQKQTFDFPPPTSRTLTPLNSQADLTSYQEQYNQSIGTQRHFTRLIVVPRVLHNGLYFPLSQRIQKLLLSDQKPTSLQELTGTNIETIGWEQ